MKTLGEMIRGLRGKVICPGEGSPNSELTARAEPAKKEPRVYPVPAGLLPRVLELYEELQLAIRVGRGPVAKYQLWSLLHRHCPETKEGHWELRVNCGWAEVVEVLS